jgi:two-component system, LytTR family, response regulator
LKSLLSENPGFKIISEAVNGDQVLTEIIGKSPQVAFLDINMPGASVFTTIPSLKNPPLVVFQTAYSEYGVKAFDINAVDYLMKPVSLERFNLALKKILISLKKESSDELSPQKHIPKDVLSVKSGESIKIIKIQTISKISFEDGFSFIHAGG